MTYAPDPAFRALYTTYTGDPDSIGAHLNDFMGGLSSGDPLLVATGSDLVIFPGNGRRPLVESFRNSTRGFVELTAISHLGVALPYLVRLRELGHAGWRADSERLRQRILAAREANSTAYWRETVNVEAWQGLEEKITDLIEYSCNATLGYLDTLLAAPEAHDFRHLRDHFLDAGPDDLPVPINDMMVATFALVFLDTGYRIIRWLREQDIDWSRSMALLCGRAGRPTAGLTWQSNSMCHLLWRASGERLQPERLYIAPHAPGLVLTDLATPEGCAAAERQFRAIWFSTRATVEMGQLMYEGYPSFHRSIAAAPVVDASTQVVSALPSVRSADDRHGFVTLLRYVMEDPGQQLANASAHYIVDQLCATDNRPERVVIPGFTNTTYPRSTKG